ncbi:hypothetical protein AB0L65_12505 [Nonomuraea sp. NPDC052116]|uniref:hypothetical protein n=1 Tax=Nonomuraea sp. NPDC052116 TaxID=3155665 RepID=UPI00341CFCBE
MTHPAPIVQLQLVRRPLPEPQFPLLGSLGHGQPGPRQVGQDLAARPDHVADQAGIVDVQVAPGERGADDQRLPLAPQRGEPGQNRPLRHRRPAR